MSAADQIPMAVLSAQLADAIAGRRVRGAVFTTFTFDPSFFELNILPLLFDQTFGQADKLRRIQLEDAMRSVDHMAVYYDRSALSQDAEPAVLDYQRIDVRRPTGCFHPKVILLLVDEPLEDDDLEEYEEGPAYQSLIIGLLSANLTRAGWWENVECAHFEQISDKDIDGTRIGFRRDLLSLINQIRISEEDDETHAALDAIHRFVRQRTETRAFKAVSADGIYFTRIFSGQKRQTFSDLLQELRLSRYEWNLEVISPFFDEKGAAPLVKILEVVQPRETRVYLPRAEDGASLVSQDAYEETRAYSGVYWADIPQQVVGRGRGEQGEAQFPRFVHAKVYRFWNRSGQDVLVVGSMNLSSSAHSHGAAGNLEAVFIVDVSREKYPRRWWLERIDLDIDTFAEEIETEETGLEPSIFDLSIQYDWANNAASYRLTSAIDSPFRVCDLGGGELFDVEEAVPGSWKGLPTSSADRLKGYLESSSIVRIEHARGFWRVLVREANIGYRPSLFAKLTPEEIMEYWSLLSADQRAAFIERIVDLGVDVEGLPVHRTDVLQSRNTLFDRFAGVFHAFGCLNRYVEKAIEEGRTADAETRLFGAKYDSLPSLLEKSAEQKDMDPIVRYVTFLSAKQLLDQTDKKQRSFLKSVGERSRHLDYWLDQLPAVRAQLPLDEIEGGDEFMAWYEETFLSTVN